MLSYFLRVYPTTPSPSIQALPILSKAYQANKDSNILTVLTESKLNSITLLKPALTLFQEQSARAIV